MNQAKEKKKIYCFDTGAFLWIHKANETIIKIPPTIWDKIESMMKSGQIISHRTVFDEITTDSKNPDFIAKWVADKKQYFLGKTDYQKAKLPEIVKKFPKLVNPDQERDQADVWLIALALEKKEETLFATPISIIVTQESQLSSIKLPAACKSFGLECLSLRGFFDEIGISTALLGT